MSGVLVQELNLHPVDLVARICLYGFLDILCGRIVLVRFSSPAPRTAEVRLRLDFPGLPAIMGFLAYEACIS